MNFIIATLALIAITWAQSSDSISAQLVSSGRRGQVQVMKTEFVRTPQDRRPQSVFEQQKLALENEIFDDSGTLNPAKVIKLAFYHKYDSAHLSPYPPHRESTTTSRPSQGQIPRPAVTTIHR